MAHHVHIPIRVVVDTATVAGRHAEIEGALRRAVERALSTSYETAVAPTGGYMDLKVDAPTFRWRGPGAARVPEDQRVALQTRLAAALHQTIDRSPLAEHDRIGAGAPLPVPPDPAERLDLLRLHRAHGLYEIPSYDTGDEVAVPVAQPNAAPGTTPRREAVIGVWEWVSVRHGDIRTNNGQGELTELAHAHYEQAVDRFGAPTGEWRGLIFRDNDHLVLDFNNPTRGAGASTFLRIPISEFHVYVFRGQGHDPPYERVVQLPPPNATTLRMHGPYTVEQRIDVARQFMEADIRTRFETGYPNPNPRVISAEEHRRTIDTMVEAELERRANDLPNGSFALYELKIGTYRHLMPDASGAPLQLPEPVQLVPIVESHLIRLGGTEGEGGSGSGGGAGGGTQGGSGAGGQRTGGHGTRGAGHGDRTGEQGFIFGEGAGGTLLFPMAGGGTLELDLGAFEDEPPLNQLGADAVPLRAAMRQLMYLLQAPESQYAGRFALNAVAVLGGRAAAVGIYAGNEAGFTETVGENQRGNAGYLNFRPAPSAAIQFLRHLSSTVPDLHAYFSLVLQIYSKREHAAKFGGRFRNDVSSWKLRFGIAMTDPLESAIGGLFARTCQVLLLQLLRSSHAAIMGRLGNFSEYSRVFEQVLLPELRSIQDLIDLRDTLQTNQRAVSLSAKLRNVPQAPGATDWAESSRLLLDTFVASNTSASRDTGKRGEIMVNDGVVKIFDGQGRLWSLEGLERAIQYKRGFVESGDPLIKQLADLEDALERFSGSSPHIQLQLLLLLQEMRRNNEDQQSETRFDAMHAFEMGQLTENIAEATIAGTTVPLQGIHLLAHETIGEFFRGDPWYGRGVQYLVSVVLGMRGLRSFFEFTIVLGLSVVCPPLGAAVGGALAVYQYAEALEKQELYSALIDPELVISRAQVEAELFAARFGLALAFVPEAGGIIARGLGVGVRAGTRVAGELVEEAGEQALRASGRGIGRAVMGRLSREAAESLKHGVLLAFAREIVTDQVMDALVSKLLLDPIIESIYKEYMTIGPGLGGGVGGAAVATAPERPTTDAEGNQLIYGPDGSVTLLFRRGAQAGGNK